MSPRTTFDPHSLPMLPEALVALLPAQGSLELQNDGSGKTHAWHYHSVSEELFVLAGSVTLAWREGERVDRRECGPGTRITLPARTVHTSTAGGDGAVYVIRPLDGGAQTVWLTPEEVPE